MTYFIIAIFGAFLASVYWWGIQRSVNGQTISEESTAKQVKKISYIEDIVRKGPFWEVYQANKEDLGYPIDKAKKSCQVVYEASHERGIAIWIKEFARFFVLSKGNNQWHEYSDATPALISKDKNHLDYKYRDKKWLIERFRPPQGYYPPYAGLAKLWDKAPEIWERELGFREWHCDFEDVYYQEFEHGYIIGNFACEPRNKEENYPLLFVLKKNSHWFSQKANFQKAPNCTEPEIYDKDIADNPMKPSQ